VPAAAVATRVGLTKRWECQQVDSDMTTISLTAAKAMAIESLCLVLTLTGVGAVQDEVESTVVKVPHHVVE
jgi:hypothetical protein